jgi:rSAM/selenodomain-associated transferase 1
MSAAHRVLSPNEFDSTAAGCCALAVMTKVPRAGQVKTRLSPPLTPEEAATLNICFLRDTSAAIAAAGAGARGIGCYTPIGAEEAYRDILPPSFQVIAQRGGTFAERLIFAAEDLLAIGFASVCLINSDSPTVPASVFAGATEILSAPNDCVVLGPADDGGYYLIGLKQAHRRLFEGIDWSTDRVLEQTLERAAELRLDVRLLPAGYDVDDRATLRRLCHDLLGPNEVTEKNAAPATQQFLREIIAREGRARIWPTDPVALHSR